MRFAYMHVRPYVLSFFEGASFSGGLICAQSVHLKIVLDGLWEVFNSRPFSTVCNRRTRGSETIGSHGVGGLVWWRLGLRSS